MREGTEAEKMEEPPAELQEAMMSTFSSLQLLKPPAAPESSLSFCSMYFQIATLPICLCVCVSVKERGKNIERKQARVMDRSIHG